MCVCYICAIKENIRGKCVAPYIQRDFSKRYVAVANFVFSYYCVCVCMCLMMFSRDTHSLPEIYHVDIEFISWNTVTRDRLFIPIYLYCTRIYTLETLHQNRIHNFAPCPFDNVEVFYIQISMISCYRTAGSECRTGYWRHDFTWVRWYTFNDTKTCR